MIPSRSSIEFLLVSPSPNIVRVVSRGCVRVYLPAIGRSKENAPVTAQSGANYARMGVEGQPDDGWEVDVSAQTCQELYWDGWKTNASESFGYTQAPTNSNNCDIARSCRQTTH
ncbi:hypothetical protein PHMEG_0009875 [Phytophthora megakarya]|uniref:Uncharacterized protein n=1 Tax=Phytophthora megakarya TaxID=4795 RepID=A0A225WF31_9STRA|nr:hypothetical protein PHMEG_0009875 [Phytophthora megakarya]